MAATVASLAYDGAQTPRVEGNRKTQTWKVTFDSSYVTGGYPVTPSMFGLNEVIEWLDVALSSAAHPVVWDQVNSKLKVFTAQGAEVAGATNLSAVFVLCQVYGV